MAMINETSSHRRMSCVHNTLYFIFFFLFCAAFMWIYKLFTIEFMTPGRKHRKWWCSLTKIESTTRKQTPHIVSCLSSVYWTRGLLFSHTQFTQNKFVIMTWKSPLENITLLRGHCAEYVKNNKAFCAKGLFLFMNCRLSSVIVYVIYFIHWGVCRRLHWIARHTTTSSIQ